MKYKKIPHCRNSSKIPHCGNSSKIPHCGNSSKIPHCGNIPKSNRKTVERGSKIDTRYTHTNTKNVNTLLSIKNPIVSCTIEMQYGCFESFPFRQHFVRQIT